MQGKDIINKVRELLRDTQKKMWSDDELYLMLDAAVNQYSEDSGIFCGIFNIKPDINEKFNYPDDYIHFLYGWNDKGDSISPASIDDIWDINMRGDIRYIYDDASSKGQYEIYPLKNITVIHDNLSAEYGVYNYGYGVLVKPFDYGLAFSVCGYNFAGDILYCRKAKVEEISDYTALIYKILELANLTDSEFADVNMATFFRNNYNARLARFKQNKHKTTGYYKTGIFY